MGVGQPAASGNAGIVMSFTLRKDDSQFESAIEEARKSVSKRIMNLTAKLAKIDTTDAVGQAANDIRQGIEKRLNISTRGFAATEQLLKTGIPLESIETAGGRYGRAGGAEIRMAQERLQQNQKMMLSAFSGTFTARTPAMTAAEIRARGHGPAWAGGMMVAPAPVGMEAGTGGPENQPSKFDQMIDPVLKSLARRGPLVAAVVASAIVSSTVGAAVMSPVVQATHGGYSTALAQSAASQQMGLGVLRGLGSIPLVGAAFSAMASRQEAEIGWAQQAAQSAALLPFSSQGMRASSVGNSPAEIAASRSMEQLRMIAARDTEAAKLQTMLPMGAVTDVHGNITHGRTGKKVNLGDLETPEMRAMRENLKALSDNIEAFGRQTGSMIALSGAQLSAAWSTNIASATSGFEMKQAANLKRLGGDPREVFKLEASAENREMIARQAAERKALVGGENNPLWNSVIRRQDSERGRFEAEKRLQATQFVYQAPTAGIYSAGEATGAAEKSSIQMGQANEMWREIAPAIFGIWDTLKENSKNTYNGV